MAIPKVFKCTICGEDFRFETGHRHGRMLELYCGLPCCNSCWEANPDGWLPHIGLKLTSILHAQRWDIPDHNAKGLLPRE